MVRACTALFALAALSTLGACFPFGLPPLEVTGGVGVTSSVKHKADEMAHAGASIRPLAAVGELHRRILDPGIGFHVEGARDLLRYGPTFELRGFPINVEVDPGSQGRLGVGAEARILRDQSGFWGATGGIHISGEYVPFVNGCGAESNKDSFVAACGYGEAAIGGMLEGNYGVVGGVGVWTIALSLTVRTPAAGGVIFGWPRR
jgi:hypothetical protein